MRRKQFVVMLMLSVFLLPINAQQKLPLNTSPDLFQESKRLFEDENYTATLKAIEKLQKKGITASDAQEVSYMYAAATFELNARKGKALLNNYLQKYPDTPYRNRINALLGIAEYYNGNYNEAVDYFDKCNLDALAEEDRDRAGLYYALSQIKNGNISQASLLLEVLGQTSEKYGDDVLFFNACIDFYEGKTEAAFASFKQVEMSEKYFLFTPYYLGAIEIQRGQYLLAEQRATLFISSYKDTPEATQMKQILGAAYYYQQKYKQAITPLYEYVTQTNQPQSIACYQLAMSYYQTGEYKNSLEYFRQVTDGNNEMAQNAYLHLGLAQLKLNDDTKAQMDFEQAANMNFNKEVKEEAMYNYALCIHQKRYSPFAESVTVFERFLNEFPNSSHAEKVSDYLVEIYMNTRNYEVALASIEKIHQPGKAILEAKQRILYRLGLQAFIDGKFKQSVSYLNSSLALGQYNQAIKSNAYYWRGEAYYRLTEYSKAIESYRSCITSGISGEHQGDALYSLGYISFEKKEYRDAITHFTRFVDMQSFNSKQKADAYNRMGDCFFYNRQYQEAVTCFQKAWQADKIVGDYSLYQCALIYGIENKYDQKVETLKQLIASYPQSAYVEQSYYELGRAYVELEKSNEAIASFQTLLEKYPKSSLARKAANEIASIYYRNNDYPKAIAAYKKVINDYPHSEESQVAAQDLKSIYVEMNKVDEFVEYAQQTRGVVTIQGSERDTLTYTAAEKIYMRGDIDKAITSFKNYLQQFPAGAFQLSANYYLGLIYYNRNNATDAQYYLKKVIAFPENKFSEEAMTMSAELSYKAGDYSDAMQLFEAIAQKTANADKRLMAQVNLLRCAYTLKNSAKILEVVPELLKNNSIGSEEIIEARYARVKAYYWINDAVKAIPDLIELAKDTRNEKGAESKYLLAQLYYDNQRMEDAEKVVLDYIETSTPYPYWLARSFILLSDIYIKQNKMLEAKQYLLSLKSNYTANDDIAQMIEERLSKIVEVEQ